MFFFSPSMNSLCLYNKYCLDDVLVCVFLEARNYVNSCVSLEWLFVCYSLLKQNWMVEVMISLIILCKGIHGGHLLSLWVFVGGFHLVWTCWSSPYSLVTTQSYLVYGVVVYDLNHLWVVACHSPPSRGIFLCYWSLHSWLWWLLCQEAYFRFGFYFMALLLYQHYSLFFGENHEGYALHVLSVVYWQVRNLSSSINGISYLRLDCHPIMWVNIFNACMSTMLSRGVLTCCWYGRI